MSHTPVSAETELRRLLKDGLALIAACQHFQRRPWDLDSPPLTLGERARKWMEKAELAVKE